ncbi:ComEC/Rec2 family competence protein [Nocardia vulneris]|uniref:ComEC/Rec2 family competence protein n=1 Tax=Nocardia vulneris TaxID=1141657 RepID=UPI0030CFF434
MTAGWVVGVWVAIALVVLAIGLWVLLLWAMAHRRVRQRAVAVVVLAAVLLAGGFAVAAAWREHQVATHPLRALAGHSVRVLVTAGDDPKPVRGNAFGADRWVLRASLREYRYGERTVRAGGAVVILAAGAGWANLSPGQTVQFPAKADRPRQRDLTVATLRAVGEPQPMGALPWWQRLARAVRTDFAAAVTRALPAEPAGLLPALVVGDTSALSDQVREDFEIAGLGHLCAVSGTNFTILLAVVLGAVRALTLGPRAAALVAGLVLVLFVIVARPDPSVLRAGAMGSITLLALVTGRRKQALPALCAAIIGLLAVWPALAVSMGFALSAAATGGLILLAPSWADWLRARGWWRLPAELCAVAAAAFVVTAPLVIAVTGKLSLVAILANMLVEPVVAPITVIGAVAAVLASIWSPLAELVVHCAAPPLWWLLFVAEHAAAVPGASVVVPGGLSGGLVAAAIIIVGILALRFAASRRLLLTVAFCVAAVLIPVRIWHPGWPPSGWVLAVCDVGQGDGLALSTGDGSAVVIDVGPEPRHIRMCLNRLGIFRIDLLVLTHPHADHIGGLTGALEDRAVAAIAVGVREGDGAQALDGVPVRRSPPEPAPNVGAGAVSRQSGADTCEVSGAQGEPARPAAETYPNGGELEAERCLSAEAECAHSGDERTASCASADWCATGGERCRRTGAAPAARAKGGRVENLAQVVETARRERIPVLALVAGQMLEFGAVRLRVLAPELTGARPTPGAEAEDANDRSIVLAADTAAGRILLTGDIEAPAQQALLRQGAALHADILKLPHHGSRTTTKKFLDAVHPRLTLISVGAENTFGHPHHGILAELTTLGTTVLRTDHHGDLLVLGGNPPRTMTSR